MRIVGWQTILMYLSYLIFFRKLGKMSQNLSSAAVVIGALRIKNPKFGPWGFYDRKEEKRFLISLLTWSIVDHTG